MLYAIICEDDENSLQMRLETRALHLQRLQQLQQQGRIILAGPHPAIDNIDPGSAGYTGSLIVAEFSSLDEAAEWARDDPYQTAGVYKNVTVKPFRQVFPE